MIKNFQVSKYKVEGEVTIEEIQQTVEKLTAEHKSINGGKIVQTVSGIGITKNTDQTKNYKILVYLSYDKKMLCSPDKLKIIGFFD